MVAALILTGCATGDFTTNERPEIPPRFDRVVLMGCYDGDTCTFDIAEIPLFGRSAPVRLLGIDAPEIRGRCPEEIAAAERARDALLSRLRAAGRVDLVGVAGLDKYRRILARVQADGEDMSAWLITRHLARPWEGHRYQRWCGPGGGLK